MLAATVTQYDSRLVLFVPTVALAEQTLEMFARLRGGPTVAVCSATSPEDDDVDPGSIDATVISTDPEVVASLLAQHPRLLLVATYASVPVVVEATRKAGVTWDAAVLDEAHRTAGLADKSWGLVLDNAALPARWRLALTATPRAIKMPDSTEEPVEVASMTNESLYGPIVEPLGMREAITKGFLSDYRVAVLVVDSREAGGADPAVLVRSALLRYAAQHPDLRSALVFCNRVADSKRWADGIDRLAGEFGSLAVQATHLDGTMPSTARAEALARLGESCPDRLTVVSNCRVLSEGVDVPALDAVVFAGPRSSAPEVVQIVGRCLRPHPRGKGHRATIVIPVVVNGDAETAEAAAMRSPFAAAWQILTALAHEDTALYTSLARMQTGTAGTEPAVEVEYVFDDTLEPAVRDAVRLKVLRRTTSDWAVFAAKMRSHLAQGGSQYPAAGFTLGDGYPLGRRADQIRQRYLAGLHPAVVRYVEATVPNWDWSARSKRTVVAWADMLEACRSYATRTGTILPWSTAQVGGRRAKIGAWWFEQRRSFELSEEQRCDVDAVAALLTRSKRDRRTRQ